MFKNNAAKQKSILVGVGVFVFDEHQARDTPSPGTQLPMQETAARNVTQNTCHSVSFSAVSISDSVVESVVTLASC